MKKICAVDASGRYYVRTVSSCCGEDVSRPAPANGRPWYCNNCGTPQAIHPECVYCGSDAAPFVNGDGSVECRGCSAHTVGPWRP
jgi:hypothetical protein